MFLFHLIYRWETLPVLLGGLSVAIRPLGRTDPSLPQTHRRQAVQVRPLRTQFLPLRPPGPPPQTPPMKMMLHLFFFLYIYILLLFPLDYLVIFLFIHCRWSHIEQNDGNKKPKWAKRSNLWQWWRKKRKKTHFSSFEKKKKTFSPSSVLTWACSWRCFQFIGSEKELWRCCATDDVCYQRNSAFACTQALTVVPFLVCSLYAASSPTSASLFFVFWLQRREKFTISLRFTIIWPSVIHKVCLLSPDDDHANKELDVKTYSDFLFQYFSLFSKKKNWKSGLGGKMA